MNTEQKAREWVAFPSTINDGRYIIIALLAERKALLDAVRLMVLAPDGCPMCDNGILRGDKPHWNTCGFNAAQQAIAMCEEQNNER